ncbi:hypothetical protein SAY86_006425 [Trapa natans]|uniref:Nicotianamine synthase n=1 Tax=Trapa natans TaxID=22666 RepID=A0AAN7LDZ9_TRANT|nr:hypothetical protein SAY86_006425 [Trapa natans]
MVCQQDPLIRTVCELYYKISALETLSPCRDVNNLLTQLVRLCIPPHPVDVSALCSAVQEIRSNLIRLCGEAEGLLEAHFSDLLASFNRPLDHLLLFPYYNNYLKLAQLEHRLLSHHLPSDRAPETVAFIGSGPLPLTSLVLASNHLPEAAFHNYDIDPSANSRARRLVLPDTDLSRRVHFHTNDIMNVTAELGKYDVVFLAALVGMAEEEKARVIAHLSKHMAAGAIVMIRSAHGARAFLYPVVDPSDLRGFEFLSVYHPTDEVINSVIVARKTTGSIEDPTISGQVMIKKKLQPPLLAGKKCCEIKPFLVDLLNPYGDIAEGLAFGQKSS